MRIAFIVFQTLNRSNGGVESISQVILGLSKLDRYVITQNETPKNQLWKDAGISVNKIPDGSQRGRLSKLWYYLRMNWKIYRFIKKQKIEVLHCNDIDAMICGGYAAKMAGIPSVFNIRDVKEESQSYGRKWQQAIRWATSVLVLSEDMKNRLVSRLGNEDKFHWIYSIVDFERFNDQNSPEKVTLGLYPEKFAVGIFAAVMPKKQQYELIKEGIPNLSDKNIHFYFIGDYDPEKDAYAGQCKELVDQLQLTDQITFLGYQKDVHRLYQAVDLVLVASKREGLARCMIESISSGTPVLSFDVCSAHEILTENNTGWVVQSGDYAELMNTLEKIVSNPNVLEEYGTNGYQLSRKLFTSKSILEAYENLYTKSV